MVIDCDGGVAEASPHLQAGVVVAIGHNQIAVVDKGRQGTQIGQIARAKNKGIIGALELGDGLF